ncbi:efflux RND transporter permease subunit [Undibacterium sp. 5I1]|uniref:efflux RND transporter permease subunit n=1 Tax=Undibacterium sp. 5I1 TaxID=3048590 RepID=UPI002AB4E148|nr:efflux RND transporter permease subunit [Undibacterium sp. 5I1]MDY7540246.1 efflux RND transporter permease subunit [Undibacterium sp. 5I1]MEB0257173.1 efflux RND transporter permease subunit [Undibacterium sp. 5I1]
MSYQRILIGRPIAITLLTLALVLAGGVAMLQLPVAPLPQVDFPTITVSAGLPGASPETMAATVATPLERALGSIAGVTEMTSSSSLGSTRVTLQFDLSRDIDGAARDVQAAINASVGTLPSSLPRNPTYRKVNPADQPILTLSLTSDQLGRGELYDVASTLLAQRIAQVKGVGNVDIGGGASPAVRVRVNLPELGRMGLSLEAVRTAISAANVATPKGSLDDGEHSWFVATNDQLKKADDYKRIIVRWQNGAAIYLGDVAEVKDMQQDLYNLGVTNDKPSVQLQVFRQPGANIIDTVEAIKAILPMLRATAPANVDIDMPLERTTTIRASLHEVERSLAISVGLVVLVVFLFLRNPSAVLIPAVVVPVSLIGTFAVMYLMNYSLDNLSLMALTIATGFVVDDAVVVLENCMRHIEEGHSPIRAAMRGAREVGFTVVSMTISLVAVFIPILAMGGIIGRYFREFAVTLSAAVLISMVVSLTTTPVMCAYLLRKPKKLSEEEKQQKNKRGWQKISDWFAPMAVWLENGMNRLQAGYGKSLNWALNHTKTMLLLFFITVSANVWLYVIVPKGFFPQQDIGILVGGVQADQSISFAAMSEKLKSLVTIVKDDPAVANVMAYTGGSRSNGGFMFVVLKPLKERGVSADVILNRLRPKLGRIAGANLFLQAASDIRIGGRQSDAAYQYTLQSDDLDLLRKWEPIIRAAMSQIPELTDVNTDAQEKGIQTRLVIDRDAVARLGLNMQMVDATLSDAFGQRQISNIYQDLNQYTVVMEAMPAYLKGPEALRQITLVTAQGGIVPLSAIAQWKGANTALSVNHQGGFAASTVSFNLAQDVSLSQATQAIDVALMNAGVPNTVWATFQGSAKAFQDSLSNQPMLILAALLAIYIVLGILYENMVHPITILSTLPSAGLGALLALMLCGSEFSVIAFIGVILLVGIVKKNAIMMIDFAIVAEKRDGLDARTAIHQACLLRLRPILMTTAAAMLGALPLALGSGDGAELRRPLGIAVVGGLLVSQWLTLYTTPVMYLVLDCLRLKFKRWRHPNLDKLSGNRSDNHVDNYIDPATAQTNRPNLIPGKLPS